MKSKIIVPIITLTLLMSAATKANESLELISPAFADSESFPVQFTCEGEGISPPLNWSGAPDGTQSLVLIMDHMPDHRPEPEIASNEESTPPAKATQAAKPAKPEGLRWYWSLYNIPPQVSGIASGQSVGTSGSNVVNNKNEYAPPCSKGPGQKNYTFHLYALSKSLDMAQSDSVSESTLRESMSGFVLDADSLTVSFERSCQSTPKPRPQNNSQQPEKRVPPSALPPCGQAIGTLNTAHIEQKLSRDSDEK